MVRLRSAREVAVPMHILFMRVSDINECNDTSKYDVPSNSLCNNTVGSYSWSCKEHYKMSDDGKTCVGKCESQDKVWILPIYYTLYIHIYI